MNFEPALSQGIVFSDGVIVEHMTGKRSYIGCFHNYNLPQFPFPVPPFNVTAFITNISEQAELDVTARIENPSNGVVLASNGVKVNFQNQPNRNEMNEITIPIFNLAFQAAGLYKVIILINNEKVGERNLFVRDVRSPAQPQQL
jgi:hypothetical protein